MTYSLELPCYEIVDTLAIKHTKGSTKEYSTSPSIFEISDVNLILKCSIQN